MSTDDGKTYRQTREEIARHNEENARLLFGDAYLEYSPDNLTEQLQRMGENDNHPMAGGPKFG